MILRSVTSISAVANCPSRPREAWQVRSVKLFIQGSSRSPMSRLRYQRLHRMVMEALPLARLVAS